MVGEVAITVVSAIVGEPSLAVGSVVTGGVVTVIAAVVVVAPPVLPFFLRSIVAICMATSDTTS